MKQTMSEKEMLELLERHIEEAGTQAAAAKHMGISAPYLCDIMLGKRGISHTLAKKLGYARETVFVKL